MQTKMRIFLLALLGFMGIGRILSLSVENPWSVLSTILVAVIALLSVVLLVTFMLKRKVTLFNTRP